MVYMKNGDKLELELECGRKMFIFYTHLVKRKFRLSEVEIISEEDCDLAIDGRAECNYRWEDKKANT